LSTLEGLRQFIYESALFALGDRDLAEDVAQESLTRVLRRLLTDEAPVNDLPAFVCGVAKHVISDQRRWEARRVRLDVDRLSGTGVEGRSGTSGLQSGGETLSSMVIQEIDKLPETDREVLKRCFVDGISCAELGRRTGEPAPRIRKRKWRAVQRLRDQLRQSPELSVFLPPGSH
jgi:RNA polymerase sigma factor (sigma-70 family)